MFSNPEFVRNVRLQKDLMLGSALLVALLLTAIGIITWMTIRTQLPPDASLSRITAEFSRASFYILIFFEFVLFFCAATAAAGSSFSKERIQGTLPFQQTTLLSPHEMIWGKLFGSAATSYVLTGMLLPLSLLTGLLAGLDPWLVGQIHLILLGGGLVFQILALAASLQAAATPGSLTDPAKLRRLENAGPSLAVFGGIVLVPGFVSFGYLLRGNPTVSFFGLPLPFMLAFLAGCLFVGGWSYVGALRGYRKLQNGFLSPLPTRLFLASTNLLLIGLFWVAHTPAMYELTFVSFVGPIAMILAVNLVLLAGLVAASTLSQEQSREWFQTGGDHYVSFRRQTTINAWKTLGIGIALAVTSLSVVWANLAACHRTLRPKVEWNAIWAGADFDLSLGVWLLVIVSFVLSIGMMFGFAQVWTLTKAKANPWTGIGLWFCLNIGLVIGGGLSQSLLLTAVNPVFLALFAILKGSEGFWLGLKGIIIELLLMLLSIGIAYWKWTRKRQAILAQEENQPAA